MLWPSTTVFVSKKKYLLPPNQSNSREAGTFAGNTAEVISMLLLGSFEIDEFNFQLNSNVFCNCQSKAII